VWTVTDDTPYRCWKTRLEPRPGRRRDMARVRTLQPEGGPRSGMVRHTTNPIDDGEREHGAPGREPLHLWLPRPL